MGKANAAGMIVQNAQPTTLLPHYQANFLPHSSGKGLTCLTAAWHSFLL